MKYIIHRTLKFIILNISLYCITIPYSNGSSSDSFEKMKNKHNTNQLRICNNTTHGNTMNYSSNINNIQNINHSNSTVLNNNIQFGKVNILKSMTFTNNNNTKQQYKTKFNNISKNNESVQIYTRHGMSNVELNGHYEVHDITKEKELESNNMKIENDNKVMNSFMYNGKSIPNKISGKSNIMKNQNRNINNISFGNSTNNIVDNINNIQDNLQNIDENNICNNDIDTEQKYINKEQNFNNIIIGENSKIIINNRNVSINNSILQKNSSIIISKNNEHIDVNNIDAYENVNIINDNNSNTFISNNIKAHGVGVIVNHANDHSGGDTIILKNNATNS